MLMLDCHPLLLCHALHHHNWQNMILNHPIAPDHRQLQHNMYFLCIINVMPLNYLLCRILISFEVLQSVGEVDVYLP